MYKPNTHTVARIALCLAACYATLAGSQSCPVVLNTLVVTKSGSGTGVVTSNPAGINCGTTCNAVFTTDATVTLTAKADTGSVFAGWTGICSGAAASASVGPLPVGASCAATFSSSTPSSGPSGAHPRLWLSDTGTFARLTAAAKANSSEWQRLKNTCDTGSPSYQYQGEQQFRYVTAYALCYQIVKANSGAAAADVYGKKAIDLLFNNATYPVVNFTTYSTDSGYGIRNYMPTMAIAYDWLYDYPGLTATLKGQMVTRMKAWTTWYAANGYSANQYYANYDAGYMIAQVLSSIALYNEDAASATLWKDALAHFNNARQKFDQQTPGGHWPEGWNYGPAVYQSYLLAASSLSKSTNDASYLNFNWLSNNVLFKLNGIMPDGKLFYDDGLWSGDAVGYVSLNDMITAGYAFGWGSTNGQIARNFIDRAASGGASFTSADEWKPFLF